MRAVVQRITRCSIRVGSAEVGRSDGGLLIYLGVATGDAESDVEYLRDKILGLRIFEDNDGKMNLSVLNVGGSICVVSQFTLLADTRKGRRPSYTAAADPADAESLYQSFLTSTRALGIRVSSGKFGSHMEVDYINDGPVTIIMDSKKAF